MPKLNMDKVEDKKKEDSKHQRRDSNSSRGSIGRKEKLRNALTGRTEGSEMGGDQPLEIPDEELCDFMSRYDDSDPWCIKIVMTKAEALEQELEGSIGSNNSNNNSPDLVENENDNDNEQAGFEGGSIGSAGQVV